MSYIIPVLLVVFSAILANLLAERMTLRTDPNVTQAFGYGNADPRIWSGISGMFMKQLRSAPLLSRFIDAAYDRALSRYAAAGYPKDKSPLGHIIMKYVVSTAAAIVIAFASMKPAIALLVWVWMFKSPDLILASQAKKNNLKLQKNIYKIYRFLNNQITSGVRVADAVKTVYTVADDPMIRAGLIEVSAKFQLTNDIERSMEEFKKRFNVCEVDSLTIALKQGIDTGNNAGILERQETYMFNKYFGYIQAETEKSKYRCFVAAMVFCLILCILFFVPIIMDLQTSIRNIIS
jgi:hypothetical protein